MKYVIITRYNLVFPSLKKDKFNRAVVDNSWNEHRLRLFREICAPSIKKQSDKDFIWLVLIDPKTELPLRSELDLACSGCNYAIVEAVSPFNWTEIVSNYVDDEEYIISTRLDNDDALARDYVFNTKQVAIGVINAFGIKDPTVIDYACGAEYDGRDFFALTRISTNFASMISKVKIGDNKSISTIYDVEHVNLSKEYRYIHVSNTEPMWLQCVHGRNAANVLQRSSPKIAEVGEIIERFSIIYSGVSFATPRQIELTQDAICLSEKAEIVLNNGPDTDISNPKRASLVAFDLRLHPSGTSETSIKLRKILYAPQARFVAYINNPNWRAEPACFFVLIDCGDSLNYRYEKIIRGRESLVWNFELPTGGGKPVDITLGVELAPGSKTADYIWTFYRDAQIQQSS